MICLAVGDVVLFQLHLLPHSKCHLESWDLLFLHVATLQPTLPTQVISHRDYIFAVGEASTVHCTQLSSYLLLASLSLKFSLFL